MCRIAVLAVACLLPATPVVAWGANGDLWGPSPSSGAWNATFTLGFTYDGAPCGSTVTFTWDTVVLGTATANGQGFGPCFVQPIGFTPPRSDAAQGVHTVRGTARNGLTDARQFTVTVGPPTAAPTPTPRPAPVVHVSPPATATPQPSPTSATCDTAVTQAPGPDGSLAMPGIAGPMTVTAVTPTSMLPPQVGTIPLAALEIHKPTDAATPQLQQALATSAHFACVRLLLGPSQNWRYATYALRDAQIVSLTSGTDDDLVLGYATVTWEYQATTGGPINQGSGAVGQAPLAVQCGTSVPHAARNGVLELPGATGSSTEPQHLGAIRVLSTGPSGMLPPGVGQAPLAAVAITKPADAASSMLLQAAATGRIFDCVHLELAPTRSFRYANYAFRDAQITSYTPAGPSVASERLTLVYASVAFEYQLTAARVVAGVGNLGQAPLAPLRMPSQTSSVADLARDVVIVAIAVVAIVLGRMAWVRRRRLRRARLLGL